MRTIASLAALAVLVVTACDDGGDDDTTTIDSGPAAIDATPPDAFIDDSDAGNANLPEELPDPLPSGPAEVTIASYNMGLIQTVRHAPERKPLIVDELKALDADVLCINEAWLQYSGPLDIATLLSDAYPYAMWTWARQNTFGNDLAIVSKYPLYRGRELRYVANVESSLDRLLISATVVTDSSHFNVICTHLTSANDQEYVEARQAQIAEIETFIADQGYSGTPTFLAGDLNCGPETDGPCPECGVREDQESYDILVVTWDDPWDTVGPVTADDGLSCTYCWDMAEPMLLITPMESEVDVRIDHILYRDLGSSAAVECDILYEEVVTYMAGELEVQSQLSDHRGVRCSFAPPASQ